MFDCVVIGGGPGGYRTAELLAENGFQVALIEEKAIGGVCLNEGCIPFKSYLHYSRINREANSMVNESFEGNKICLDQEQIYQRKEELVKQLSKGLERQLEYLGVTIKYGHAGIDSCTPECIRVAVGDETISGKYLVLALGSREKKIESDMDLDYHVISAREMLEIREIPSEIDIIGSGAVGLEAASYYADAGSHVTLIEMEEMIGGHIDSEISACVTRMIEKKGINVITGMRMLRFERDGVIYQKKTDISKRQTGYVLLAMGRKPVRDEDMFHALGVASDEKGIKIDDECRTSNPKVYACGDVTGKWMLAHGAYLQASMIAHSMMGEAGELNDYVVPRIIYSNPEVLSVGDTEDDCKKKNESYSVKSIPMTYSGKYFAEHGKDGGYAKMIINESKQVIGFHMVGNSASEIGLAAEMMISYKMTVDKIKTLVFPHPTCGEIIYELARQF